MFPSFQDFISKECKIAVVGLGYVGLPLLLLLGKKFSVLGFDIDQERVRELNCAIDRRGEIAKEQFAGVEVQFVSQPERIREARFIIVTVPTPVDKHKRPDLTPVIRASETVGRNLSPHSIVVFESTVYPGVTEEICVPILEKESGLVYRDDFKVGYAPERVNPGDGKHTLEKIVKIVSGSDCETTALLSQVYGSVIEAGVHCTFNIKTAEAAKVIENTQRDLNIALMNELSIIFHRLGLDTREVLAAAGTKWNFLSFEPGLVGGHCIGVDPYYLTYKAEEIGYTPQVILAGRQINDSMGKYVAEQTIKLMIRAGKRLKGAKVIILGMAFKENVRDVRNTRVIDIYRELQDYELKPYVFDPVVLSPEVQIEYGVTLLETMEEQSPYDAMIIAVRHDVFSPFFTGERILPFIKAPLVLVDVKGVCDKNKALQSGFYWKL